MNEKEHLGKIKKEREIFRFTASIENQNKIAEIYISKSLGLGNKIAQRYGRSRYDFEAERKIGAVHSGIDKKYPDIPGFWKEIKKIFPKMHSEENYEYLIKTCDEADVYTFVFSLSSPISRRLEVNAHCNK